MRRAVSDKDIQNRSIIMTLASYETNTQDNHETTYQTEAILEEQDELDPRCQCRPSEYVQSKLIETLLGNTAVPVSILYNRRFVSR
jgi:hypothetical protein